MSRPPVAKPGPMLSLESMQDIAKRPGGIAFLRGRRSDMQALRDQQAEYFRDQLAELDAVLARLTLVIDGGVQA